MSMVNKKVLPTNQFMNYDMKEKSLYVRLGDTSLVIDECGIIYYCFSDDIYSSSESRLNHAYNLLKEGRIVDCCNYCMENLLCDNATFTSFSNISYKAKSINQKQDIGVINDKYAMNERRKLVKEIKEIWYKKYY